MNIIHYLHFDFITVSKCFIGSEIVHNVQKFFLPYEAFNRQTVRQGLLIPHTCINFTPNKQILLKYLLYFHFNHYSLDLVIIWTCFTA